MPAQAVEEETETPTVEETPAPAVSQEVSAQPIQPEPTEPELEEPDGSVRVNLGTTKALTGEVGMLGTASANALTASGVTWTSSNPAVATVDQSGVVTAVDLGQAIITATKNGTVIETYTVNSTLQDGVYAFQTYDGMYSMSTRRQSILNGTELVLKDKVQTVPTAELCARMWYVDYLDNGYYSIHPYYYRDIQLTGFGGVFAELYAPGTFTTNIWQWRIYSGNYGYVIENRYHSDMVLSSVDGYSEEDDDEKTALALEDYEMYNIYHHWSIDPTPARTGILAFDTYSGAMIGDSWNSQYYSHTQYINLYQSKSLSDLNVLLLFLNCNSNNPSYSLSSSKQNIATVDNNAKFVTGHARGRTIITVTATINGSEYSVGFALTVCKTIFVNNYYDSTLENNSALNYIEEAFNFANAIYGNLFNLQFVCINDTTLMTNAPADSCPAGPNVHCTPRWCASMPYNHHKNVIKISRVQNASIPDDYVHILWCNSPDGVYCNTNEHASVCSTLNGTYGMVVDYTPFIHMLQLDNTDIQAHMGMTLAHELSHTLGLSDVSANDRYVHDGIDGDYSCLMELHQSTAMSRFYNSTMARPYRAFCDTCYETLYELVMQPD